MAEETQQERTESATPRKREDARKEGRVARSQELNSAAVLLGAALVLNALTPKLGLALMRNMQAGLLFTGTTLLDRQSAIGLLQGVGWKMLGALMGITLSFALLAGGTAALQGRGVLTMQPLQPKLERLNPLPNLKKFLGIEPWANLLRSIIKLGIVGIAVWRSLASAWSDSLGLAQTSPAEFIEVVRVYGVRLLLTAGLCYLAFAALDYGYQIWRHEKDLRMSKQEIKDEAKQSEGDPMAKARLRSIGRSFARRQMFQEVARADVVITNPTHIAVALKYDPARADAPVVVAMGQRKIAERIKQLARDAGVPMVENRPLARALLASARVGTPIPPELYLAVAEVLAWVIGQRGRTRPVLA